MDRWRRWRSRRPAGRAGARRAGVTALALLVVTAALAVLLAVLFHLAWPPVLVSILGTVPTLYLAWLRCPAPSARQAPAAEKPAYGRRCGAVGSGGAGRAPGDRRRADAGVYPQAA